MTTLTLERLNRDDPRLKPACVDRWHLFEDLRKFADRERIVYAQGLCRRCPILLACENTEKTLILSGGIVFAGIYHE